MLEQVTPKSEKSYAEAIQDALEIMMKLDERIVLIGEGVPDPKAIFETTCGLREKFGNSRVFDMPLAENGLTGICIGGALTGLKPIMVHQRIDFSLLAMDQLVNNASKWHIMFGGQHKVPLVVRMVIGRGWGQGPQHSQSLQATFSHIPGLKVVMPAFPEDAKGMLISAIDDNNPVIFLEHRWVHMIKDMVPNGYYKTPIGKANILCEGQDITIAGLSYMSIESYVAAKALKKIGIFAEVIDLRSCSPLDSQTVIESVMKTGHLLTTDTGHLSFGVLSELCAQVTSACFSSLKSAPQRIASPDYAISTSHYASNGYYPEAINIAKGILTQLGKGTTKNIEIIENELHCTKRHDVPNPEYRGPF